MSDLIKREDAIRKIDEWIQCASDRDDDIVISEFLSFLKGEIYSIPSADRPQGEWVYGEHNVAMCDGYRCNRCDFFVPWDYEHKFINFINDYHFCPNCGARMKGAEL